MFPLGKKWAFLLLCFPIDRCSDFNTVIHTFEPLKHAVKTEPTQGQYTEVHEGNHVPQK